MHVCMAAGGLHLAASDSLLRAALTRATPSVLAAWLPACRLRPASCGWCKCSRWRRWRRGSPPPSSCCGAPGTASFQRWRRLAASRRSRHSRQGLQGPQRALLVATALPSSRSWGTPPPCGWQRRSAWPSTWRRWVPLPASVLLFTSPCLLWLGMPLALHSFVQALPVPATDSPLLLLLLPLLLPLPLAAGDRGGRVGSSLRSSQRLFSHRRPGSPRTHLCGAPPAAAAGGGRPPGTGACLRIALLWLALLWPALLWPAPLCGAVWCNAMQCLPASRGSPCLPPAGAACPSALRAC